jgi:hypothetical protein
MRRNEKTIIVTHFNIKLAYFGHDLDALHLIFLGGFLNLHRETLLFIFKSTLLTIELSDGSIDEAFVFAEDLLQGLVFAQNVAHGCANIVIQISMEGVVSIILSLQGRLAVPQLRDETVRL